jgi:CTD small phosphatase-like protein 2
MNLDKMTIVFDLDETLVHCFEDRTQPHQLELPVRFSGGSFMLAPLNIRPGAKEMLAELSQNF